MGRPEQEREFGGEKTKKDVVRALCDDPALCNSLKRSLFDTYC